MEAKSLASLNYLASNPPQYPIKPTEEQQESLVLYISRVPGTRGKLSTTLAAEAAVPNMWPQMSSYPHLNQA